jgi:hypothetical protein
VFSAYGQYFFGDSIIVKSRATVMRRYREPLSMEYIDVPEPTAMMWKSPARRVPQQPPSVEGRDGGVPYASADGTGPPELRRGLRKGEKVPDEFR